MKVEGQEAPSGPEKPAPDKERFQQVLREAGARRSASAPAAPTGTTRPGTLPAQNAPKPGGPSLPRGVMRPGALPRGIPSSGVVRPTSQVVATARSALASPENLGQARQVMHAEAARLGTVRGEAQAQGQERAWHRVSELIARELARDDRGGSLPSPAPRPASAESSRPPGLQEPGATGAAESRVGAPGGAGPTGSADAVTPPSRAEAALELIERIEVFVKSQRPALSLSLRGALEATVEVERTGPREVALRIQGRSGPVPSETLTHLRDALEARGLRLRSLRAE